jgi:WD40 repeat protein
MDLGKSVAHKPRPVRLIHHVAKQRLELAHDVSNDYVTGFAQHATFSVTPIQSMLLSLDEGILASLHRSWQMKIAERKRRDAKKMFFATHYTEVKSRSIETFVQRVGAVPTGGGSVTRAKKEQAAMQLQQRLRAALQDEHDEGDEKIAALRRIERMVRQDLSQDFSLHFSFEAEKRRLAAVAHRAEQARLAFLEGRTSPHQQFGDEKDEEEWQAGALPIKPFVVLLWDAAIQTNLFDSTGKSRRFVSMAERRVSLRRVASLAIFNAAAADRRRKRLKFVNDTVDRRKREMKDVCGSSDAEDDDHDGTDSDSEDGNDADFDFFDRIAAGESDLFIYLADLFKTIDKAQVGTVTWDLFISYMIETVYMPQLGQADSGSRFDALLDQHVPGGSLIYKDSMKLTYPLYTPHWISRLNFFKGWDAVAIHDGSRVAVAHIDSLSQEPLEELGQIKNCDDDDEASTNRGGKKKGMALMQRGVIKPPRPHLAGVKPSFITAEEVRLVEHRERLEHLRRVSKAAFIDDKAVYLAHGGTVMASEYIGRDRIFITSASEGKQLRFWSVQPNMSMKFINHLRMGYPHDCTVTAIRAEDRQLLRSDPVKIFYGTRCGHLIGDAIRDECSEYFRRMHSSYSGSHVAKLHSDAISDIVVCPRTQQVVTGGLDGRLFMHQPFEGDPERSKVEFVGHERGILSLAYCHGYEIIISAGFEYHAMCWSENVTRAPAFCLRDPLATSQAAICSVFTVPHTPHVYTVDLNAIVKLFDIRTLKTIGSWGAFDPGRVPTGIQDEVQASCGKDHVGVIGAACFTGAQHRSILVAGKCVHKFVTESRSPDVDRCLDNADPIVATVVGKLYILTAAAKLIRLWRISDGGIAVTFQVKKYSPHPLTAVQMNDVLNKVVCGHEDGGVNVFSIDSGLLLRRYVCHVSSVGSLLLDNVAGILVTVTKTGEMCFWRDQDSKHKGNSLLCHLNHPQVDECRRIPEGYNRPMLPLAADEMALLAPSQTTAKLIRRAQLAHWALHRWSSLVIRNRLNRGLPEEEIIRRTLGVLRIPSKVQSVVLDEESMKVVVLCSASTARIVSYLHMPPTVTHRMFHGKGRPLVAACLVPPRSLCVVSDSLGMLFVWVVADGRPAVLASCFSNRCLVSSYSKPTEEFAQGGEAGDDDDGAQHVKDDDTDDPHQSLFTPPENPVPCVTAIGYDCHRNTLITGDDVGHISLWELDEVLNGYCDAYDALQLSQASGGQPFWIFAWRAGQAAVQHVSAMPHTMAAILAQIGDNSAAIWTVSGDWICSLRQGPVVDRSWHLPNQLLEKMSLIRIRYEKLYQAGHTGRLAEIRRVDDGGEPKPRMHVDLFSKLSQRVQLSHEVVDDRSQHGLGHRRAAKAVMLHRRFSTSFRGTFVKKEAPVPPPAAALHRGDSRSNTADAREKKGAGVSSMDLSSIQFVDSTGCEEDSDDGANDSSDEEEEEEEEEMLVGGHRIRNRHNKKRNNYDSLEEVDTLEQVLAKIAAQRAQAKMKELAQQREQALLAVKHADKTAVNSALDQDPDAQKKLHILSRDIKKLLVSNHERTSVKELEKQRLGELVHVRDHREYVEFLRKDEASLTGPGHGEESTDANAALGAKKKKTCRGDPMERYVPLDGRELLARRSLLSRAYCSPAPTPDRSRTPVLRGTLSLGGLTASVAARTAPPRSGSKPTALAGLESSAQRRSNEDDDDAQALLVALQIGTPPSRLPALPPAGSGITTGINHIINSPNDDGSSPFSSPIPSMDPRKLFAAAMASSSSDLGLLNSRRKMKITASTSTRVRVEALLRPLTDDRAVSRASPVSLSATGNAASLLESLERQDRATKKKR